MQVKLLWTQFPDFTPDFFFPFQQQAIFIYLFPSEITVTEEKANLASSPSN
jgi:hypothetical protein